MVVEWRSDSGAGQGIGRLEEIRWSGADKASSVDLGLAWFYRPGEEGIVRTKTHYDAEVWQPVRKAIEWVKLESLHSKIRVHDSLEDFEHDGGPDDYFVNGSITFRKRDREGVPSVYATVRRTGPSKPSTWADLPLLPVAGAFVLWSESRPVPLARGLGVFAWRVEDGRVGIAAAEQDVTSPDGSFTALALEALDGAAGSNERCVNMGEYSGCPTVQLKAAG
jgi:hypothetical protein